jgi:hypothetical protein
MAIGLDMARARRFAPHSNSDVANELDLLDMVDEAEQYEIVRSFAAETYCPLRRDRLYKVWFKSINRTAEGLSTSARKLHCGKGCCWDLGQKLRRSSSASNGTRKGPRPFPFVCILYPWRQSWLSYFGRWQRCLPRRWLRATSKTIEDKAMKVEMYLLVESEQAFTAFVRKNIAMTGFTVLYSCVTYLFF